MSRPRLLSEATPERNEMTTYTNEGMTQDTDWIESAVRHLDEEVDTSSFVISLLRHLASEVVALRRDVAELQFGLYGSEALVAEHEALDRYREALELVMAETGTSTLGHHAARQALQDAARTTLKESNE